MLLVVKSETFSCLDLTTAVSLHKQVMWVRILSKRLHLSYIFRRWNHRVPEIFTRADSSCFCLRTSFHESNVGSYFRKSPWGLAVEHIVIAIGTDKGGSLVNYRETWATWDRSVRLRWWLRSRELAIWLVPILLLLLINVIAWFRRFQWIRVFSCAIQRTHSRWASSSKCV